MTSYSDAYQDQIPIIADLVERSFTASEGAEEGKVVGALAKSLMESTPSDQISVFTAWQAGRIAGAIIFSKMFFTKDKRNVAILSPVAVAPDCQSKGVGTDLINHGLNTMSELGKDFAVTYGDPNYYSRFGFRHVTTQKVPAPFPLSHPHGWQALSLIDDIVDDLKGEAVCVPALHRSEYW